MAHPRSLPLSAIALLAASWLTGCGVQSSSYVAPTRPAGSIGLAGNVHGGQQPVAQASIQLWAVNTTTLGGASTPLLATPVLTDASGNFNLDNLYTCGSASYVYITATGGNPGLGAGGNNPNLTLMTALGLCSSLDTNTFVTINELTTVAAVGALYYPFMTSLSAIGTDGSNVNSLIAAFQTAAAQVSTSAGTVPGTGTVSPYLLAKLNTLADILAACVNTGGGTAGDNTNCGQLFGAATPAGFNSTYTATDTVTALLYLERSGSSADTVSIFKLLLPAAPFQPTLATYPTDASTRDPGSTSYLSFSPSSLNFGATALGASAQSQTISVTEHGNAQPSNPPSITGANPDDFTLTLISCPNSVCSYTIVFTPHAPGPRTANVNFSPYYASMPLALAGMGIAPAPGTPVASLSSSRLTYTIGGSTRDVTVTNTGTGLLNVTGVTLGGLYFIATNGCNYPLINGQSCAISILNTAPRDTLNGVVGYYDTAVISTDDPATLQQRVDLIANNTATASDPYLPAAGYSSGAKISFSPTLGPINAGFALRNYTVTNNSCSGGVCTLNYSATSNLYTAVTLPDKLVFYPTTEYLPIGTNNNFTLAPASALAPIVYTITNNSNMNDLIDAVAVAPPFTQTNNCGTVLYAQSICTITISPALNSGTVAPGSFHLAYTQGGYFIDQTYRLDIPSQDVVEFGTWPIGFHSTTPHSIGGGSSAGNVTPTGPNAADFSPSSCPYGPNGCTLNTVFTPSALGQRVAQVSIFGVTAPNFQNILTFRGFGGVAGPNLFFTGPAHPKTILGTPVTGTLNITNTGSTTLVLTNCTISGTNSGDFAFSNFTCPQTVAPGANLPFAITFNPAAFGVRSATVNFTDSVSQQTFSLPLSGFADYPADTTDVQTTGNYHFPSTPIGQQSPTQSFTINAAGRAITASLSPTTNFAFVKSSCAQGEVPCVLTAYFKPTTTSNTVANVTVTDFTANQTITFQINGTGTAPATLTSTVPSVAFTTRPVGSVSIAQSFYIKNTGLGDVSSLSIAVSGTNAADFTQTNSCPATLYAGYSCQINVSFAPLTSGSKSANITATGANGSNLPFNVPLTGTAQ